MKLDYQKLLGDALKFLGLRPRSRQEMVKYLEGKTQDHQLVSTIITKLEASHLIDDHAFATWLVESRTRHNPRGKDLVMRELKLKGISPDIIAEVSDSRDENSLALAALQKKLDLWTKLSYRDYRVKATRFLASRGFSWGAIESAVKKGYNHDHVS